MGTDSNERRTRERDMGSIHEGRGRRRRGKDHFELDRVTETVACGYFVHVTHTVLIRFVFDIVMVSGIV